MGAKRISHIAAAGDGRKQLGGVAFAHALALRHHRKAYARPQLILA